MRHPVLAIVLAHLCCGLLSAQAGENSWNQWRGPTLQGASASTGLPLKWSVEDGTNVAWVTNLEGRGNSTPVVSGDHIFLTMTFGEEHQLVAACFSRKDGGLLWKHALGACKRTARDNNMASPSPVTDGRHVWFLFGQGTLAAFDMEGKHQWTRNLEETCNVFTHKYGYTSSPLLHDNTLYIPLLRRLKVLPPLVDNGQPLASYLIAINPETGKTRWRHERLTPAEEESLDAYNTPVLYRYGSQAAIVLSGGDLVTGHDPKTGKELWRYDWSADQRRSNWRVIASPVVAGDLIVAPTARGRSIVALRPDAAGDSLKRIWQYEGRCPDVCTPAYHEKLIYVIDGRKRYLTCLEAKGGEVVWQEAIDTSAGLYASPTVADGRIYTMDLRGTVRVYAEGRKLKQLAEFSIGKERCPASIVVEGSDLLVRTPTRLICARKSD